MAPLPRVRLQLPLRAFAQVSVDYGGPFITVQGRGIKTARKTLVVPVHLFGMQSGAFGDGLWPRY